jgi:hypothetical protein
VSYCPACGTQTPAGARFCGACGDALEDEAPTLAVATCSICGGPLHGPDGRCSSCAELASPPAAPIPVPAPATASGTATAATVAPPPKGGRSVGFALLLVLVALSFGAAGAATSHLLLFPT